MRKNARYILGSEVEEGMQVADRTGTNWHYADKDLVRSFRSLYPNAPVLVI